MFPHYPLKANMRCRRAKPWWRGGGRDRVRRRQGASWSTATIGRFGAHCAADESIGGQAKNKHSHVQYLQDREDAGSSGGGKSDERLDLLITVRSTAVLFYFPVFLWPAGALADCTSGHSYLCCWDCVASGGRAVIP